MLSKNEIIEILYEQIREDANKKGNPVYAFPQAFKKVMNKVFKTVTIESEDERKYSDKEDFLSLSETIQDEKFYNLNVNQTGSKEKRTLQIMVLDYNEL